MSSLKVSAAMRGDTTSEGSNTVASESLGAPSQSLIDLIDNLPYSLSVDILCRFPSKFIIQCTGVSKSWYTLISQPCFHSYFLSLQKQKPLFESTLMFVHTAGHQTEFFAISEQTPEFARLKFCPKFKVVVGTYNDLVLCCAIPMFQRYYYICNPYTKQWVSLPPTPQCHQDYVHVGFICDSNHRCTVVRILECEVKPAFQFKVEIFSSETGEWTESVVPCPPGLRYDKVRHSVDCAGIACNGTLYWLGSGGFLIGLEPFEFDNNCSTSAASSASARATGNPKYRCHYISKPHVDLSAYSSCDQCLDVYWGRPRLCQLYYGCPSLILYTWELKEDDHEVDGVGGKMMNWCLKEKVVVLDKFILKHQRFQPLAFDPNDEDTLYLLCHTSHRYPKDCSLIVIYNIRTTKVIGISKNFPVDSRIDAFPLVLPCLRLPTPVPGLDFPKKLCAFCRPETDRAVGISGLRVPFKLLHFLSISSYLYKEEEYIHRRLRISGL